MGLTQASSEKFALRPVGRRRGGWMSERACRQSISAAFAGPGAEPTGDPVGSYVHRGHIHAKQANNEIRPITRMKSGEGRSARRSMPAMFRVSWLRCPREFSHDSRGPRSRRECQRPCCRSPVQVRDGRGMVSATEGDVPMTVRNIFPPRREHPRHARVCAS